MRRSPGNPHVLLYLARALVVAGEYEEAQSAFVECFECSAGQASFIGVRLSYVLGELAELARVHPPALEALRALRDVATQRVHVPCTSAEWPSRFKDKASLDVIYHLPRHRQKAAAELIRLNTLLGEQAATLETFARVSTAWSAAGALDVEHRDEPQWVFDNPFGTLRSESARFLIAARDYARALEVLGDALALLRSSLDHKRARREILRRGPRQIYSNSIPGERALVEFAEDLFLCYEALVGTGEHDSLAEEYREMLLEADSSLDSWTGILRHTARAGRAECLPALYEAARRSLPKHEYVQLPPQPPAQA